MCVYHDTPRSNALMSMYTDLHDLSVFTGEVAGPEDVRAGGHAAALVWLLEEMGRGHGAVGAQRLVVLLPQTGQLLQGGNN